MSIYENISEFHNSVGTIAKDSTNPHFKNKYADINTVLDAIREPLKTAKLSFVQIPKADGIQTILSTLDGKEQIESFIPYILAKNDMQQLGSAITYGRRYALVTMLGLEQEDDDGNRAVQKAPPKPETLSDYLGNKGISPKAFTEYHKITTKEQALELLSDKAGLNQLISEFVSQSDATI